MGGQLLAPHTKAKWMRGSIGVTTCSQYPPCVSLFLQQSDPAFDERGASILSFKVSNQQILCMAAALSFSQAVDHGKATTHVNNCLQAGFTLYI